MLKQSLSKFAFITLFVLLAVLALSITGPARAAEIVTGDNAVVAAGEVIDDDLFIAGQSVRMDGTVHGDVFAGGREVVINGTIDGNLFIGAQTAVINGQVDGSVYSMEYAVVLGPEANIAGNIFSGGFALEASEGSQVGRSLYSGGYQAVLSGSIGRDANFSGAAFRLNGSVGRNLTVQVAESDQITPDSFGDWFMMMPAEVDTLPAGYEQSPSAVVGGEVNYEVIQTDRGDRVYTPRERTVWGISVASGVFGRVADFLSLFVVGAILLLAWPAQVSKVEGQMTSHPWRSLGLGLVSLIAFPFVFLIAILLIVLIALAVGLVTLGNLAGLTIFLGFLSLGVLTLLFFFAGVWGGITIFSHYVGERIFERGDSGVLDGRWGALLALLVGLLLYEAIQFVPVLGGLLAFALVLLGLGAIVSALWIKESKPKAVAKKAKR